MMQFAFCDKLSEADKGDYLHFYNLLQQKTIEQHPDWPQMERAGVNYSYFIARKDNNDISCAAVIIQNTSGFFKTARIQFGPLFSKIDELLPAVKAMYDHFLKKNFMLFSIQLAMPSGFDADYLEYLLNRDIRVHCFYNRENWSSLQLDLGQTEEEIFRNFSKGHKSDIKKATKHVLTVSQQYSEADWEKLLDLFVKMNERRGLTRENDALIPLLGTTRLYFERENEGVILVVRDGSSNIIGGVLLAFQGNTVRYFKGASDPDQRQLPVLHLAIWEGIKLAKQKGFKIFDFWGYNHFVSEGGQVFYINRFKKGFGGIFSFYPKKMYFIYKPWRYKLYLLLKNLSTILHRS